MQVHEIDQDGPLARDLKTRLQIAPPSRFASVQFRVPSAQDAAKVLALVKDCYPWGACCSNDVPGPFQSSGKITTQHKVSTVPKASELYDELVQVATPKLVTVYPESIYHDDDSDYIEFDDEEVIGWEAQAAFYCPDDYARVKTAFGDSILGWSM